ncbi:Hsp70 family protein-like protein [Podospora didyma]|uniref:Hsp70 family protein-like protein n=1 Tax=Podospora didyma TaxID=330526 RepID=A0AAE0KKZ1_9PEZI|nr:Hsp70 family protein-like protein [Podospora didyma]
MLVLFREAGLEGQRQPKLPTVISYDPNDFTKFKWGGHVDWRSDASDLKKLPKDAVDVAADFIGAICNHALSKIEASVPRDYFLMCQKQFVLSVPAVWSDKAKDTTLRAAKKAGIHPVSLAKEPEAAALYTLYVQERALGVGDAFVLNWSLELASGMAGSLGLNKRFSGAVQNVVGDDQWLALKKSIGWAKAQAEFDKQVKPAFKGNLDEYYFINFPQADLDDNPDENLASNCWNMTGKDVKNIFDPLITDILRLIDEQVKNALIKRQGQGIKGIFLVGGFGSSLYLKAAVEKEHPGIQVIQPDDAWVAIVKGAVLSRLPNQASVVSTQAVRHYGVAAWPQYEPAIDKCQVTKIFPDDGTVRCRRMTWYIYSGEDLKRDQKIKFPFFRTLEDDFPDDDLLFDTELVESESKMPPTYPNPGIDTKTSCLCTSDLRTMDRSLLQKKAGTDGKTYYNVHYDLVVSTEAANMRFSLEVNGVEMGAVLEKYS